MVLISPITHTCCALRDEVTRLVEAGVGVGRGEGGRSIIISLGVAISDDSVTADGFVCFSFWWRSACGL